MPRKATKPIEDKGPDLYSRSFAVDSATELMLRELSNGRTSRYLRQVIAIEYGKLLERKEREQLAKQSQSVEEL